MKKNDLVAQAQGIMSLMESLSKDVDMFRQREADCKIQAERDADAIQELMTKKIYEIASMPDMVGQSVDPRTGKADDDWAKILTQIRLQEDEEFRTVARKTEDSRAAYEKAVALTRSYSERLGTCRSQAILLSSLLRYLAGDDELAQ
jgi:hypothetical protein